MSPKLAGLTLAVAVAATMADDLGVVVVATLAALLAALVLDPPVVRSAAGVGLALATLLAAAAAGSAVTLTLGPERGLSTAAAVACRMVALWLVAGVLGRRVDADVLVDAAARLRLARLGLVLGLALNALPRLAATAAEVWLVHRLRSPGRWAALRRAPRLAELLLAHVARIGDDAAAAAALRGHAALTHPRRPVLDPPAPVVIVTGAPGSGKTPAVEAAVAAWRRRGLTVTGILQPGLFLHDRKVGFRVRDLDTGAETDLARLVDRHEGEHGTRYRFDPAGLELAASALGRAAPGTVLVVDEVGPVELRGDGHMPALRRALATPGLRAVVLVVRRHLVPSLLATLSRDQADIVDVEAGAGARLEDLRI